MPSAVSWRYDHATEPWLRWLVRIGAASLLGGYVLMLAMGTVSVVVVFVAGSTELRLLVLVLALVGGPFSLLYLLPMLRDRSQRPSLNAGRERVLSTRELATCGAVGAVALGSAFVVEPLLAGGLFAVGLAAAVVGFACGTGGEIDPESGTASNGYREWDLSRVTGYSTRRIGPLAFVSLSSSGPGSFGTVPSWLLVPATVADDATAALDAIIETTDEDPGREPNPAVRAVALAFAVLLLVGAVALVKLGGPLGWHAGTITALFGVIFLVVAREG